MSTTTLCSETSVDFEVQNILGAQKASKANSNESQEIIIDFDSSVASNHSFLLSNSNKVKRSQTFNNRKNLEESYPGRNGGLVRAHSITRSSAERSLDEMSLYDQMFLQKSKKPHKKDPRVEEYRNLVLAEIKSMTNSGALSRSLSESDLSELCGASVGAPSPDDLRQSLPPSDEQSRNLTKTGETATSTRDVSATSSDVTAAAPDVERSSTSSLTTPTPSSGTNR